MAVSKSVISNLAAMLSLRVIPSALKTSCPGIETNFGLKSTFVIVEKKLDKYAQLHQKYCHKYSGPRLFLQCRYSSL